MGWPVVGPKNKQPVTQHTQHANILPVPPERCFRCPFLENAMAPLKLARIRRKPDYYQNDAPAWVRNVWPRPESFDWFIKHRRAELVAAGAVVRLGRDYFVDAVVFPKVASRILGITASDVARAGSEVKR